MVNRSEEDILTQAGFDVILGGKKHSVRPLVIRDAREWRRQTVDLVAPLSAIAGTTSDTPDDFGNALRALLVDNPDKVIDLFFLYAKDLKREVIEGIATEEELTTAFREVIAFAFPLAKIAPEILTRLTQPAQKKTRKKNR